MNQQQRFIKNMDKGESVKKTGILFVKFTAYLYIVLGILFLVNPAGMASGLGYENLSNNALTDVMASYGGLWIGIGLLIFYILKKLSIEEALWVIGFTFAGFAFGRIFAVIRLQGFYGDHCYWLAFELVYLLITKRYLNMYSIRKEK